MRKLIDKKKIIIINIHPDSSDAHFFNKGFSKYPIKH